ncbi:TetR/AcrR family transcriptional regulator [Candidatus Viadribacter manganicus]|uniref:TetR family transcriptional regulator n=1 Tax=Candidatus Viadribacter manganicus TaxID=1759059 RepID=A0A1B1AIZ9_9PROT|nr:TetR/AcrR family transcriptional regulator [Candidatus Viadribacter manganicus]ANP46539.1 TetR family transcriptional regulator [Candidatus Viadribacter manganicus]
MSQYSGSESSAIEERSGPKTERGRRTLRRLLDAAAEEFGARGYHETAISSITQRAGVGLGTFYVYFKSKEEVFRALVADMGARTRHALAESTREAPNRLEAERLGIQAYLDFVRSHKALYRVVMEAQFVAPEAYREYYRTFSAAYRQQLAQAASRGEISEGQDDEVRVWALMGASTFLGLRYGVWDDGADTASVAEAASDLMINGLAPRAKNGDAS